MRGTVWMAAGSMVCVAGLGLGARRPETTATRWDARRAAAHLDGREAEWQQWPRAAKDHGTVCVSCHTTVPYALARPALREQMGEKERGASEAAMLKSVRTRVMGWEEMEPFYNDAKSGTGKTKEAYATEPVLNALVLARYGALEDGWNATEQQAFEEMWAKQIADGPEAGGWTWLNFHNSPWEGNESAYYGAMLAEMALKMTPKNYQQDKQVEVHAALLRAYLRDHYEAQPLANRVMLLWVEGRGAGVLTGVRRAGLLKEMAAKQNADGGWAMVKMADWKRHDGTVLEPKSDGCATGLALLALRAAGMTGKDAEARRALGWLEANQDGKTGAWAGYSLNREMEAGVPGAQFMTDAATGFGSLAMVEFGR